MRSAHVHHDARVIGHCLLECEIEWGLATLHLFAAHFDSYNEDLRLTEARYLHSLIEPTRFNEGTFLLAGDLNALSRADPYPADLAERLLRAGVGKYGHPPRFDAIDEVESFGWVDVLRRQHPPSRWVTAPRQRGGEMLDFRTDYLFASPRLAERFLSAGVVDAGKASDHHALMARFDET